MVEAPYALHGREFVCGNYGVWKETSIGMVSEQFKEILEMLFKPQYVSRLRQG